MSVALAIGMPRAGTLSRCRGLKTGCVWIAIMVDAACWLRAGPTKVQVSAPVFQRS